MKYNLQRVLKNHWFFIIALIATIALLSTNMNHDLFFWLNSQHYWVHTTIWEVLVKISGEKMILSALLLAITLCFRRDKTYNVLLLIAAYLFVFYLLKITFHEARPYIQYNPASFHWLPQEDMAAERAYRSFPSGHSGIVAIFVFAISRIFLEEKPTWYKNVLKSILIAFLLFTMLAQICTGWHFPADVLGSGLIGYFLALVIV